DARIALRHRAADFVRDIARIEILFVDDLRRRVDLRERAEEAELLAVVLVLPLPAILAADADVHLAHRHVPAWIALPFSHELGFRVRIPHQLAGSIERTRHANFAITRQRNFCRLGHCLLLDAWSGLGAATFEWLSQSELDARSGLGVGTSSGRFGASRCSVTHRRRNHSEDD